MPVGQSRRSLQPIGDLRALLQAQITDRTAEADRYDTYEQHEAANRLRREADALRKHLAE